MYISPRALASIAGHDAFRTSTRFTPRMHSNYAPLDSATKEIRLLTILPALSEEAPLQTSLRTVSLRDDPKFEALSYTWGNDEPRNKITINGRSHLVRDNLFAALRRLRWSFTSRHVWIDAICINQEDLHERSEQVKLMRNIYQQGTKVVVWIGEPSPDDLDTNPMRSLSSRFALPNATLASQYAPWMRSSGSKTLVQRYWNSSKAIQTTAELGNEQWQGPVAELLDRPWWRRVWVVQEAVLACEIVIQCGPDIVPWSSIDRYISWQRVQTVGFEGPFVDGNGTAYPFPDELYQVINSFRERRTASTSTSIYNLLYDFRKLSCTDPRDRVFGFLGLADDIADICLQANYNSPVSEVYITTAKALIAGHLSLDTLNCRREPHADDRSGSHQLSYSLADQARYHDVDALISDGPGSRSRRGWIRLPQGWEGRSKGGKVTFHNHLDQQDVIWFESPLAKYGASVAQRVSLQRILPPGWIKEWDSLGRTKLRFTDVESLSVGPGAATGCVQLPSWVPDWNTHSTRDPYPLLDWESQDPLFWASGRGSTATIRPSEPPNVLSLDGVVYDKIETIADPWFPGQEPPPISRARAPLLAIWEALGSAAVSNCPYQHGRGREHALWRTFIADAAGSRAVPYEHKILYDVWCDKVGWTPKGKTSSVADTCLKGVWETIQEKDAAGSQRAWHKHYVDVAGQYNKLPDDETTDSIAKSFEYHRKLSRDYAELTKRIHKACANRALFVTAKGYIGLAPWNACEGDVVAILLGGKTPYLLRPCHSGPAYEFVGETYLHGLMEGEAMDPATSSTVLHIDIV